MKLNGFGAQPSRLPEQHRSTKACWRQICAMASDDEDVVGLEQPPQRQKRFTFQRFAQRVAQVYSLRCVELLLGRTALLLRAGQCNIRIDIIC